MNLHNLLTSNRTSKSYSPFFKQASFSWEKKHIGIFGWPKTRGSPKPRPRGQAALHVVSPKPRDHQSTRPRCRGIISIGPWAEQSPGWKNPWRKKRGAEKTVFGLLNCHPLKKIKWEWVNNLSSFRLALICWFCLTQKPTFDFSWFLPCWDDLCLSLMGT